VYKAEIMPVFKLQWQGCGRPGGKLIGGRPRRRLCVPHYWRI